MGLVHESSALDEDMASRRCGATRTSRSCGVSSCASAIVGSTTSRAGWRSHQTSVDQREVDEKRGYFKGALYYVQHLPRIAERRLEKKEE